MNVKCRIVKQVCNFDDFYIFGAIPIEPCAELVLHPKYHNFTLKGELGYLTENKVYELNLSEQCDKNGVWYKVEDCPTLSNMDFTTLSYAEAFKIMCEVTTAKQATELLDKYPNFIQLVMEDRVDEIDVKKLYDIKKKRLATYVREVKDKYKYYHFIMSCKEFDLSLEECKSIDTKYHTVEVAKKELYDNPYNVLINICGRGFEKVDSLCADVFPELRNSDIRCEYLMLFVLQRNEFNGSTKMNANEMAQYTNEYAPELTSKLKSVAISSELIYYDNDTKNIAIMGTYLAECNIAQRLNKLVLEPKSLMLEYKNYQHTDEYNMTDEQCELLRIASECNIGLLLGNAGSGKSTSIGALINMLDDNNLSYTLLAPTGISAKVLSKCTRRHATTIHRRIAQEANITTNFVIIDEMSMVGVELFSKLLTIISTKSKIILVADNAQLASISCGNVLQNIIDSGIVPTAKLTKIFRYGEGALTTIATDIREGKSYINYDGTAKFLNSKNAKDYEFHQISSEPLEQILKYYKMLLQKYSFEDIMILSPFNVGSFGTYAINSAIQDEYNILKPHQEQVICKRNNVQINFRSGDKVINIKNNYNALTLEQYKLDIGATDFDETADDEIDVESVTMSPVEVMNGDIGYILSIENGNIMVQFDENVIVYTKRTVANLLPAYAISVHKCQGSQSKVVMNITHPQHTRILNRSLLYVADTRAEERLVEIGDVETINNALRIVVTDDRKTFLLEELLKGVNKQ
ncbi:MAG: AAA family ATPase [Oscillospiraceae bacterium]